MSEETQDPMTKAQREAVCKAWDLLTEHFEGSLLVVDWETDQRDENGTAQDARVGYWHGGSMRAIGLAVFAKDRVLNSGKPYSEPDV
jgi:hypothetical protein